jgi:hypothetical protein
MLNKTLSLFLFLGIKSLFLMGQETARIEPTDMSIPTVPAFQMLDANSPLVNQPGVVNEFKVDWSFKSYRLQPNLALEFQPIWAMVYNRPDLKKYRKANAFSRQLSTLSLSGGNLDQNDTVRLVAGAVKINLFRSYDPLLDTAVFEEINSLYVEEVVKLDGQIKELRDKRRRVKDPGMRYDLDKQISDLLDERFLLARSTREQIREKVRTVSSERWNTAHLDLAIGQSYRFLRPFEDSFDSIELNRNGFSIWLNGGMGLSRRTLLTGLLKLDNFQVDFPDSLGVIVVDTLFVDPNTGEVEVEEREVSEIVIRTGQRRNISLGVNLRYGSPRFNGYVELVARSNRLPTFADVKWDRGGDYNGRTDVFKFKQSVLHREYIVSVGGEWRMHNNVLLSYGLRTFVDHQFRFRNVFPVVNITCLMR